MNSIKRIRFERDLSQWDLAMATGIPRWTIQLIEAGHRCPTKEEFELIANVLGVREQALRGTWNQKKGLGK